MPEVERNLIRQIFFFFISYPEWSEKRLGLGLDYFSAAS